MKKNQKASMKRKGPRLVAGFQSPHQHHDGSYSMDDRYANKEDSMDTANRVHRTRFGTPRIYSEPVLDNEPLYRGKMSAIEARHILGYSPHDIHSVKSKHGPENLGNSPQLGEGEYAAHRQTVIPKRHLK
jgi:hypothetical protein